MHEYSIQYKGAPLELWKKTMKEVELEKENSRMLI